MPKAIATITTVLELVGLSLIIAGVYVAFGLASALIIAGALLLSISFLLTTTRGGRK
jgi:hypothetical protein